MKYFFKYSGKKSKPKEEITTEEQDDVLEIEEDVEEKPKAQYTLDELLQKGQDANEKETNLKTLILTSAPKDDISG